MDDGGDKLHDDALGKGGNDRAEGCADDDGNCEVDYVATKYEVAKSLEHGKLLVI